MYNIVESLYPIKEIIIFDSFKSFRKCVEERRIIVKIAEWDNNKNNTPFNCLDPNEIRESKSYYNNGIWRVNNLFEFEILQDYGADELSLPENSTMIYDNLIFASSYHKEEQFSVGYFEGYLSIIFLIKNNNLGVIKLIKDESINFNEINCKRPFRCNFFIKNENYKKVFFQLWRSDKASDNSLAIIDTDIELDELLTLDNVQKAFVDRHFSGIQLNRTNEYVEYRTLIKKGFSYNADTYQWYNDNSSIVLEDEYPFFEVIIPEEWRNPNWKEGEYGEQTIFTEDELENLIKFTKN